MLSLHELETAFARAVFGRDEEGLAECIAAGGALDASERIDVYRNNVLANYRSALRDLYPTIATLVGARFFDGAAQRYALDHPSDSGDLHDFGASFGEFLQSWAPAAHLEYLRDVAKLEWAMHGVFHAADAAPLDLRALADVPPDALQELRFELNPAARLVASAYPLLDIWEASQPGAPAERSVSLNAGAHRLLVIRRDREIEIERLAAGELALLEALALAVPLGQAHARALEVEAATDLDACLRRHVLGLTLVGFYR